MESEIFLLILIVCSVSSAPRIMEADRFRDSIGNRQAPGERIMPRGNAKNNRNLWLKRNESLSVKFCQYEEGFVSVRNVLWSNDGWLDTILVKMDDVVIGNFTTNDDTNWGFSWNKIHESGPVGSRVKLSPGEHTLTLEVVDGDRFGVEFDRIVLDVEVEQRYDNDGLVCPEKRKNGNSSKTDNIITDNTGNITNSVKNRLLPDITDNGDTITDSVENKVDKSTFSITTDKNGRNVTGLDSSGGTVGDDVSTRRGNGNGHGSNSKSGNDEDQRNDVTQRRNGDDAMLSSENSTATSGDVLTAKSKCRESKEYDFWNLALAFWEWINRQID